MFSFAAVTPVSEPNDLDDVHLEPYGIRHRRMHQAKQCSKVLITTVTQYQLSHNAQRLTATDAVLYHRQNTAGTTTLTKHTYK